MAEAPLIMLAVMTGSMFALTGLAKKADGGEGYVDPNRVAPSMDKATNVAAIEGSYAVNTGNPLAGSGYMGALRSHTALNDAQVNASPTLMTSAGVSEGTLEKGAASASAQQAVGAYADHMASMAARFGKNATSAVNAQVANTSGFNHQVTDAAQQGIDHAQTQGTKVAETSRHGYEASGGVNLGVPNPLNWFGGKDKEGGKKNGGGSGPGSGGNLLSLKAATSKSQDTSIQSDTGDQKTIKDGQSGQQADNATHGNQTSITQQGSTGTQAGWDQAVSEAYRLGASVQQAMQRVNSAEHSLQEQQQGAAQSSMKMGALTEIAQASNQAVQQEALSYALPGAASIARQATSDPAKAEQIMNKLQSGVDRSGAYSPMNLSNLMRNATNMLRSGDYAEQAVGYKVAAAVSQATGFGDSQGLNRMASAYAESGKMLESARSSLTPGLSSGQLATAANLEQTAHDTIAGAARTQGVSDPSDLKAITADVKTQTMSGMMGKYGAVKADADGEVATANAQAKDNGKQGQNLERRTTARQLGAEVTAGQAPGNQANPYREGPHYGSEPGGAPGNRPVQPQPKPTDAAKQPIPPDPNPSHTYTGAVEPQTAQKAASAKPAGDRS